MKFALIILAAGFSRRMGVLKPLLPVGGISAVLRCVQTAVRAGISDVFIVTGHMSSQVEQAFSNTDFQNVRFIHNNAYHDGMFSSILAGVKGLTPSFDGFFLLPSDCCAVSHETLLSLISRFTETGGTFVVRPKLGDKRGHPPLLPASLANKLLSYSGEDGMRGFLNTCRFELIFPDDPGILLDMDTPQDYAALLEHLSLPSYPDEPVCHQLFEKYKTPVHIIEHGKQVSELSAKIACKMTGAALDLKLLKAACLLHDIARAEENHAKAGEKLLLTEGFPKAAMLVGAHMDLPPIQSETIGERELLYLSDKLCRSGNLVHPQDTMKTLSVKFAKNPEALQKAAERMEMAQKLLDILKERYAISFTDISIFKNPAGFNPC